MRKALITLRAGLVALLLLAAGRLWAASPTKWSAVLAGPDASVNCVITADEHGLQYSVHSHDKPIIQQSPIVVLLDGNPLTDAVEMVKDERSQIDETYSYRGVHSQATNRCNTLNLSLRHANDGKPFTIEVRVFNDGVAFRYIIPGDEYKSRVPDEQTMFNLPAYSTVWYHDLSGHYEATYKQQELAEVSDKQWCAPPMTFKLPDDAGYASITEAALVNYPGMALEANGRGGFQLVLGDKHPISHPFELRYKDDIPRMQKPAAIFGEIKSPWRVILVGADLNTLVNSDIVPNLCPPPDPKLFPDGINTAWCKPGRAVWRYLDEGERGYEGEKAFTRMAGELSFEYNVIEGVWRQWTDQQLKDLVAYGKDRGVGIWVWVNSKNMRDPKVRHDMLQRCHDLGIVGLKIDFFDHEAKEIIDLYQALLKEGAEQQLLFDFHGANKPTGEQRTWPNEMTREAIRGMESKNVPSRAVHETTLPFTRFLAGPAEYTPVIFGERRGDTTWAHQAAVPCVFTTPLLTYGCNPQIMLDNPCGPMLKSIPAIWDETIVLPESKIGELAAFARRSGDRWFLAVLNGIDARHLSLPVKFLGDGKYETLMIRDVPENPEAVKVENADLGKTDNVVIDMPKGGGFIARFTKK